MVKRLPWDDKYRPRKIEDFIGLPGIRRAMKTFLRIPEPTAFLFTGDPGVGKTSMALVMGEELRAKPICIASEVATHAKVSEILAGFRAYPADSWWNVKNGGMEDPKFNVLIVDEIEECTLPVQRLFFAALDGTRRIENTIFFFTSNTDKVKEKENGSGLERRFSSRCQCYKFTMHGYSTEAAARLKEIWKLETGLDGDDIDFDRLFSESGKNVRGSLKDLQSRWLERGGGLPENT